MAVTVASFDEPWEAHIFLGLLESEGIPGAIAHEHHVWANWMVSLALGGVKVQVEEADVTAALDVADGYRNGRYAAPLEESTGERSARCPKCDSTDLQIVRSKGKSALMAAAFVTTSVIFPVDGEAHRCQSCGYSWPL